MRIVRKDSGDTLIEVLVAMTALSVVITLSYAVMTRSFAQGQVSLERTATQGMVAGQISMLRDIFARHELSLAEMGTDTSGGWATIAGDYMTNVDLSVPTGAQILESARATTCGSNVDDTDKLFYLDPEGADDASIGLIPFSDENGFIRQGTFPKYGDGMWIEGYRITPSSTARPYYDFYVKACWDAAISGDRQVLVTNVRFYEAR